MVILGIKLKQGVPMYIQLSELKTNPSKYFDLAKTTDVIVTRHGRRLGRIICEEDAAKSDRENAFSELMKLAGLLPSVPDATVYDPSREDRLREKGLLG
jgi:prevent-host-death family protein